MPRANSAEDDLSSLGKILFKDPAKAVDVLLRRRDGGRSAPHPHTLLPDAQERRELRKLTRRKHVMENIADVRELLSKLLANMTQFLRSLEDDEKANGKSWTDAQEKEHKSRRETTLFARAHLSSAMAKIDAAVREKRNLTNTADFILDVAERAAVYVTMRKGILRRDQEKQKLLEEYREGLREKEEEDVRRGEEDDIKKLVEESKKKLAKMRRDADRLGHSLGYMPVLLLTVSKGKSVFTSQARNKTIAALKNRAATNALTYPVANRLVLLDQMVVVFGKDADPSGYGARTMRGAVDNVLKGERWKIKTLRVDALGNKTREAFWVRHEAYAKKMDGIFGAAKDWTILGDG